MKRIIISAILCIFFGSQLVFAVDYNTSSIDGLHENWSALFYTNYFTQEQIEEIKNKWYEYFDDYFWNEFYPAAKTLGKTKTGSEEEEYQYWLERNIPDFSKGLLISNASRRYMAQYAENGQFKYLFSDKTYWVVLENEIGYSGEYLDNFGNQISSADIDTNYNNGVMTNEIFNFLSDEKNIEILLLEKGETKVTNIKLFYAWHGITLLYIQCEDNEYIIKLYGGTGTGKEHIPQFALYKLYPADEVMQALINKTDEAYTYRQNLIELAELYKPTYDAEAEKLQEAGLLQGNENGLDLLKPLTRAEAVTLLVRALGLESETVNYTTSEFSDIANDNWAAPYAALAKSRGIANGISETEFAPDERVTSDQFAAFALRAIGESDFDYTEGTEILIDKGIITEEQAETMDLFTRGDMAKIIYEMREMGLMQK